jgi:hypothetical protein
MAHLSVRYPWRQNAEWSFKAIGADWADQRPLTVDFHREFTAAVGLFYPNRNALDEMVTSGHPSS